MRALPPITPAELAVAVVADDASRAQLLVQTLEEAGYTRLLRLPPSLFWCPLPTGGPVHVVLSLSPQAVAASLDGFEGSPPCPLSLVGPAPRPDVLTGLLDQGLAGWWPDATLSPAPLAAALASDAWIWRLRREAASEASRCSAQPNERRWTERVLQFIVRRQRRAPLSLEEACRLLQGHARQDDLPLQELARLVIEASRWAEAVNRAGQLRMLSQLVVRFAAQSVVQRDGDPCREATLRLRRRVRTHLALLRRLAQELETGRLQGLPGRTLDLSALENHWRRLDAMACAPAAGHHDLAALDDAAGRFLAAAESAVAAVRAAAGRPSLGLVDQSGRQRMAVQRIAKDGVLGVAMAQPWRLSALPVAMDAVDAVFAGLADSPQLTQAVRAQLEAAQSGWQSLRREHRRPEARNLWALVKRVDELLPQLETLTDTCEAVSLDILR